jgi:ribosomal protein S18 acetylase RimI-like enzyme
MSFTDCSIRPARPEDAAALAKLVNYAGEGLPLHLWSKMADTGQDAWSIGEERAAREVGSFSYRNAIIMDHNGKPVGALIAYGIPQVPEPVPAGTPAIFVPLQELENLAPDTWYINVVATLPEYRDRGLGKRLLAAAEDTAARLGKHGLSLIVSNANHDARRLYERLGYREAGRRRMVKEDWVSEGEEWILLVKRLP